MNRSHVFSPMSKEQQIAESIMFFHNAHKQHKNDIQYIPSTDSFLYLGEVYDYYQSGINSNWDKKKGHFSGTYKLVTPLYAGTASYKAGTQFIKEIQHR